MAKRPIFIPSHHENSLLETEFIDFQWHPGISVSQKQKSIKSLHTSAEECLGLKSILEISSKSQEAVGINASAFNLKLRTENGFCASVESFYQGSKIFGTGKVGLVNEDGKIEKKLVAPDGSAVEMQLEMKKDDEAKEKSKGKGGKGGGKKKGGAGKAKMQKGVKKLTAVSKAAKKK